LPAELGGGPVTTMTRGLIWAVVGAESKGGGVSANLVIQSQDATAAEALARAINKGLQLVAENEDIRKALPDIQQITALLKPTVNGDKLSVAIKAETLHDMVTRLLAPALSRARSSARRSMSARQLCELMKQVHIYGNDHKGQWPENWDTLIKSGGITRTTIISPERQTEYVYIRPSDDTRNLEGSRLVLYEAYEQWGEGIAVAFADSHAEFIGDEAKFKQLLAEALAKGTKTGATTQPATPPERDKR
jgi:hypothetical protein